MSVEEMFDLLFKSVEHGDEEHRQWLKDEFDKFIDEHDIRRSIIYEP